MTPMIRTVAKVQGLILILLAVSSLSAGKNSLHGALNIELQMNIIHLLTGSWLVLAGYARSEKAATASVAVLSAAFFVMGASALSSSFGIVAHGYSWIHEVIRLAVALLGAEALIVGRLKKRKLASEKSSRPTA
ncbi:MAG: hypothetical protein ACR2FF_02310 [Mycobacteriales bacterium]